MAEAGRFPPPNQTGAVRRRGRRAYGSDPNRYRGLRQPGARRGIRAAAEPGHGAGGRVYPTPALQPHTPDARRTPCIRWTPWTGWRAPSTCCCSAAAAPPTFRSRAPGTPDAFTWWTASTPTRTFPPTLPPWTPRPGPAGRRPSSPRGGTPASFPWCGPWPRRCCPAGRATPSWGRGVSQGHSDAVRRIPGVRDARQYTIPVPAALDAVRSGANPALTTRQKHMRECFVVAEEGADRARIEQAIITIAPLLCRLRHHGALSL